MKVDWDININKGGLETLISRLPQLVSDIVEKTAFDCQAEAQDIVPVDTGNLKGSISAKVESPTKAVVEAAAEYAGYVEYGTYKMAAQPYMMPAAEIAGTGFLAALEAALESLV